MIDFPGRVAVVTGGNRGIGRATALLLARAGADVAITCHTRLGEADAVVAEIERLGRRALRVAGDHADPALVTRMFAEIDERLGRVDLFVANAGVWPPEEVRLGELSDERWRRTVAANLDGVFLTTRAALRRMPAGGSAVLVSSTAGQRGEAGHADYAATKGAVIALTKSLAVEYAPRITVNCVAPGWVDTEMAAPALGGGARERIAAG
ncbi:MAG TPA: SDR family oxidoreductase, partial [Gemmatimonadales bacterium]|nr:SDR family oxidoreductase [Gemmatimonadales bacterium]